MKPEDLVNKLLEIYTGPQPGQQPEPEPEPEPYPTIDMGTVFNALPPGTDEQVINLLNAATSLSQLKKQLEALLTQHAAALEKIGLVPSYLAWMLAAIAQQQRGLQ